MSQPDAKHQPVPLSQYVMVWVALLLLTVFTITAASLHVGGWSVLAAIAIATVKGALVLLIFMNLRYEDRIFIIMLLVAMFTLGVILLLTFIDLLLR